MTGSDVTFPTERTAVDKALSLLTAFGPYSSTGIGVSELARRTRLTKSTAFRLLGVLLRNGVVERVGSNYRLGRALHELGGNVYSPAYERLGSLLTPFMADMYEQTHETVHLAVLHGTDVFYVNKLFGYQRVRSPSRLGGLVPAYCTAIGKVLLAYDAEATDATLSRELKPWTNRTIVDPVALRARLTTVRQVGVAFDDGEAIDGLTCVAAPIFGPDGRPMAALSVSGAADRFDPRRAAEVLRRVCFAAGRVPMAAWKQPRAPATQPRAPATVGPASPDRGTAV